MDLKPRTPLPPGMVPSASEEDLSSLLEEEQKIREQRSKDIVKEGSFSEVSAKEGTGGTDLGVGVLRTPVAAPGAPPEAWRSATEQQAPDTFQIDLSGNDDEEAENGIKKVPVFQGIMTPELGKTPRRKLWSPFSKSKDKVHDLREEVLSRGGESFSEQQSTPKRKMSSLKKNKVAPSPARPATNLNTGSNFTSLMYDENENSLPPAKGGSKQKPDDILLKEEIVSTSQEERPLTPTIIVKSRGQEDLVIQNDIEERSTAGPSSSSSVEALYSTVVKPKCRNIATQGAEMEISELITELPKLETHDPEPTTDTSFVLENQYTHCQTPNVDDHAYELVDAPYLEAPDIPVYSASVYKELMKHQDTGNVQLVSVKGTISQAKSFPIGSSSDMSPLHYAAASGDKKELGRLLSSLPVIQDPVEMVLGTEKMCGREGLEVSDSEGRTPIMHAVHNNHLHGVKMLAEVGANVNTLALDGSTCLHQAAYSGSIDMVALLMGLGADGLTRDSEGRTPLHWCTNNTVPETIDLILDKVPGLNVDVRDSAMMTPLMWAAFHGHQQHVMRLIERGADPQLTDVDGMTAAHWSVQRHDTRTLQVLISPASAGYRDNKGKTVMHQAAERGSAKAVSLIKAVKPTSVNDQDNDGRTPLHWATVCESPDAVRALLTLGANTGVKDFSEMTAMDYATQKELHYCALLLSQAEGFDDPDNYHLIPTFGATTAAFGTRALQLQEGQVANMEDVENVLTKDQIKQLQTVCSGTLLSKFSNEGRGQTHSRFTWVNPSNTKICWAKDKNSETKDTKSDILVGVRSSASPMVFSRKDFDPMNKHKYSFSIFTASRVLDMVALSSEDYKNWLNGLQLVLHLGSINTTRLLSIIQNASGTGEMRPIP